MCQHSFGWFPFRQSLQKKRPALQGEKPGQRKLPKLRGGESGTAEETPDTTKEGSGTSVDSTETNETTQPAADNPVLDVVVPIQSSTDTVDIAETTQPAAESLAYTVSADVVNVIVPINVNITIDPLELGGKGQIYSDVFKIENDGDNDVLLTFTDIQVTFSDAMNFEALAQPFNEGIGSNLKSIFMQVDFGRSDVPPAIITDFTTTKEAITIPLSATQDDATETSMLQLNFSGSVNYAPSVAWEDNDVKICMTYKLEVVPPPVEIEIPLTTEDAIEIPATEKAAPDTGDVTPPVE